MSDDYDGMAEWQLIEILQDRDATIEGLGQTHTELEKIIAQHEERYARVISMLTRRQTELERQKSAYLRLAKHYTKVSVGVAEANKSVRALKDVPVGELDHAIGVVANAIDSALLQ